MTTHRLDTEQIRDTWESLAPGYDEFVTPENIDFGRTALGYVDVAPGSRFLDVAAGSGALSIPAARRGADVVATDIAPTMIERLAARARREGLANLRTVVMDGQDLEFADGSFDVSASQYGVSLFPDVKRGLREMVRVTRPGGRVLVVAFGAARKAEFVGFFTSAVLAAVPSRAPLPMDPPALSFEVSDPNELRQRLVEAGLTDVTVNTTTWDMEFDSGIHFWNIVTSSNPVGARLVAGLTAQQCTDVQRVMDGMLRERAGGQPGAVLHTAVNIGTGTK